ncbi:tyrosine-protein phosphatase [Propioniciclava sinopodophylli]|uniref:tyrosine-protein phosphatase n=1 Tax=Propioniciclava sinopodophylli TaxID=1837344 RepID=UPI0019D5C463|nr:tyrosine-protein phosphatase [Propioniciclava sinopodophylli]
MSAELPEIGWIDLPGVVNMRDLGGKPAADGRATGPGRVIRTDNLQDLPPESVRRLVDEFGVTDVVDLRTNVERASTGNGPLKAEEVTFHELTLYAEDSTEHGIPDVDDDTEPLLPWQDEFTEQAKQDLGHEQHLADHYSGYLERRPDNVLRALRAIAQAPGTVLVHCAAGPGRPAGRRPEYSGGHHASPARRPGHPARRRPGPGRAHLADKPGLDRRGPRPAGSQAAGAPGMSGVVPRARQATTGVTMTETTVEVADGQVPAKLFRPEGGTGP